MSYNYSEKFVHDSYLTKFMLDKVQNVQIYSMKCELNMSLNISRIDTYRHLTCQFYAFHTPSTQKCPGKQNYF